MPSFSDRKAAFLYTVARSPGDSLIDHEQRVAVESLGDLAMSGNPDAREALLRHLRSPDLHPLLREMAMAALGPGPAR
ncbi:MAG: hypothetical protein LUO96_00970 [Methanomicrobiales archaeon]|nr:hypothetical protein [Methanomicrobiales archaeon]